MGILALIFLFLLLYLQTQEAVGITVMVYYAAVREKSRAVHFQPTFPTSFSCFYWWHFDGILGKCKLCALSRLSRWHLESIKHGLKDSIEAPLTAPSVLCAHTQTHTFPLSLFNARSLLLLPNRCILSSKSQMLWKPTSQFALRTGARRRRRCAKGMPILWCLTNA